MSTTNQYLQECFIPEFWQTIIEVMPRNTESEYTALPKYIANSLTICQYISKEIVMFGAFYGR